MPSKLQGKMGNILFVLSVFSSNEKVPLTSLNAGDIIVLGPPPSALFNPPPHLHPQPALSASGVLTNTGSFLGVYKASLMGNIG